MIIGVGTRYTDFTTSSKWLFREDAKFVNINVSEFQALKLDAVPVIADAKRALPALLKELRGYQAPYTGEIETARDRWARELHRLQHIEYKEGYVPEVNDANAASADRFAKDLNACLTQTTVLGAINFAIDPEDVAIGSAGSLPGDMQRMWCARGVDTYNMEYGYSCMGYEISGALGVKYAIGDRDVYAMVGDGSFIMLHSELLTAVQEHRKINVCVFNNASFGCINNLQVGHGNDTLCTVPGRGRGALRRLHLGGLREDRRGVRLQGLYHPIHPRAAGRPPGSQADRRRARGLRHPGPAQVHDRGLRLLVARGRHRGLREPPEPSRL